MDFKKGLLAVVTASALLLGACSSGSSSTEGSGGTDSGSAEGGTINLGVAYETTNYHPSETSSALAMGTNWHVMEGLYELNMDDYSTYPALAAGEPTEVSDTELEVTLRDGAKFSDGTDVTSEDVVKSFERSMNPDGLYATMLDFIDEVTAKDDTTVTIKLKNPFRYAKERLAIVKIVPADATDEELTSMPIGTGPYKYDSITDSEITASANENYNGPNPADGQTLHWSVIKDDTARTTAAQSGDIDIMEAVPAANREQLEAAGMTVEEKEGFNLPFLLFNTSKAPFDNAMVRQAFFYAIDTDKLIENNMDGTATKATSFLPESNPAYSEASTQFDYNPDRAKELLADAGVNDLSITLLTTDHTWITDLAPQIQQDLQAVGIDVSLQSEASASLYSNNLDVDDANFDVALAPGDPSVFGNDPALLMNWWYGDNVWTKQRSFWQESDPEAWQQLNTLIDEATQATDENEAADKWAQAQDLLSEEVPIYPLFHRHMLTAYYPDNVEDFKPIATTGLWAVGAKATK